MRREGSVADGFQIFSIDGQREILPHADAYLKQGPEPELKSNEFQTPPRTVASSEKTEALPPLPSFPVAEQEEDQEDPVLKGKRLKTMGPSEATSRRWLGRMHRSAQCSCVPRRQGIPLLTKPLKQSCSKTELQKARWDAYPNRTRTAHSRLRVDPLMICGQEMPTAPSTTTRQRLNLATEL